jgi:CBS domain containing-hemolysin-like protein
MPSAAPSASLSLNFIRGLAFLTALLALLMLPARASASLLSPEAEDKLADILAVVVIVLVPIIGIVVFWLLHIMPEKIAHQRHHPQFEAIRTLCLLSLLFGGLLWPLAWLWAYSKPVVYKMAYGTDKSPDYYKEHGLPDPHDENGHTPADDGSEPVA